VVQDVCGDRIEAVALGLFFHTVVSRVMAAIDEFLLMKHTDGDFLGSAFLILNHRGTPAGGLLGLRCPWLGGRSHSSIRITASARCAFKCRG